MSDDVEGEEVGVSSLTDCGVLEESSEVESTCVIVADAVREEWLWACEVSEVISEFVSLISKSELSLLIHADGTPDELGDIGLSGSVKYIAAATANSDRQSNIIKSKRVDLLGDTVGAIFFFSVSECMQ